MSDRRNYPAVANWRPPHEILRLPDAVKRAIFMGPEHWQEQHSPTEAVMVRVRDEVADGHAKRVTRIACTRRKTDARLWDAVEKWDREWEADEIERGAYLFLRPLAYKTTNYDREIKTTNPDAIDHGLDLMHRFQVWSEDAAAEGVNTTAVLAILLHGWSARQCDAHWRKRRGWAMANLKAGLDHYTVLARRRKWRWRLKNG